MPTHDRGSQPLNRPAPNAATPTISPLLFGGLAVASIGGPLALGALYVPGAAGGATALAPALGALLYGLPLLVWLRYGEEIVSAGGLTAFVAAAAGRRVATVHGAVWAFSYFLYLPYTITDIAYEQLVVPFPGLHPWRPVLQVLLPIGIVALLLCGTAPALWGLVASAVAQLALLLALGAVGLHHASLPSSALTAHSGLRDGAAVSLLFVCGSLPLYLGAEVRGGKTTVRRSLLVAWAVVGIYVLLAVLPLAGLPGVLRDAPIPGDAVAAAYGGRAFAVAIGLGVAVSVLGVVVAEYLALSRLLHSLLRIRVRAALLGIGVPFVAIDAAGLADPDRLDNQLLRPSLVALFVSQVAVTLLFPLYRARRGRLGVVDVAVAAAASALLAWGLYRAAVHPLAS